VNVPSACATADVPPDTTKSRNKSTTNESRLRIDFPVSRRCQCERHHEYKFERLALHGCHLQTRYPDGSAPAWFAGSAQSTPFFRNDPHRYRKPEAKKSGLIIWTLWNSISEISKTTKGRNLMKGSRKLTFASFAAVALTLLVQNPIARAA